MYKKGDVIKLKDHKISAKYGQLVRAYYGEFGVVKEVGTIFVCVRMFKYNTIIDIEEMEIAHKIKPNKLNKKLYNFWD